MNLTENPVQVQNKTNTSQFRVKRLLTVKLGSHLWSVSLAGNSDKFNGLVNLLVKCLKMLLSGFVPVQVWLLVRCSYRLSLVERCWHGGAAVCTFASQQPGCRFEARGLFCVQLACSRHVCPGIPGIVSLCGPAVIWQLAQGVTPPSPSDSWDRLQQQPWPWEQEKHWLEYGWMHASLVVHGTAEIWMQVRLTITASLPEELGSLQMYLDARTGKLWVEMSSIQKHHRQSIRGS